MDIEEYVEDRASTVSLLERRDILPKSVVSRYAALEDEYKCMSEQEIKRRTVLSIVDERIRISFWRELPKAIKSGKMLRISDVIANICDSQYFITRFLDNKCKLAWLGLPVIGYEDRTDALLNMAVSRYDELVNMDITSIKKVITEVDDEGKPVYGYVKQIDVKKAELLLKTINVLEDRVKGMAVKKSVNVNETAPRGAKVESMDIEEIDRRIKQLQGNINNSVGKTMSVDDVIDAECTEVV